MRARWSSQTGFLFSAAGSAIGLGNIWKFPYVTGMNGGGLFVLFYLLCIFLVAFPVMIAEISIGQKAQANAIRSFNLLEGKKSFWSMAGLCGVIATVLISSFYSVIGGWILYYLYSATFHFDSFSSQHNVDYLFDQLLNNSQLTLTCQWAFLLITLGIVLAGINKGIEKANKLLLPLLMVILLMLLVFATNLTGFSQAVHFLFSFNSDQFTWASILEAIGHSFFTVSVGVGIMITFGSYLNQNARISGIASTIIIVDTIVALISGLIIFSIVFSNGVEVGQGPVLMFKTLPLLFHKMTGGLFFASSFFLLLAFTAITSAISLLEVPVAYLVDSGLSRKASLLVVLLLVTFVGSMCALSFSTLSNFLFFGQTVFDLCDSVSTKFLLPISGLMCVLFFSYKLNHMNIIETAFPRSHSSFLFRFAVKIIAPVSIVIIMIFGIIN